MAYFRRISLEELFCGANSARSEVVESLADPFVFVGEGGKIHQALVFGRVLQDDFGFAVDG